MSVIGSRAEIFWVKDKKIDHDRIMITIRIR